MQLPKTIELYYTAELFRLIQKELAGRDITVTKHEDLAAMHYIKIGRFTTMNDKDGIICTYSDADRIETGLLFMFNGRKEYVTISSWLMMLWPVLLTYDSLKKRAIDTWFNVKYKWLSR